MSPLAGFSPRGALVSAVVAMCLASPPPTTASENDDLMIVPGGIEAVSRLLGNVNTDREEFPESLNRALLRTIRADHDWEQVKERADLVVYFKTVSELQANLSFPVRIEGSSPEALATLDGLARILGFELDTSSEPPRIEPRDDPAAAGRRATALALGWNVAAFAHRLSRGETITIELLEDVARFPIPLDALGEIVHRSQTPRTVLLRMAVDQRLGLVVEGMSRVTRETREALEVEDLKWLYRHASIPFFRYSAALEMRNGSLRLPGGPEVADAWESWVGVDPDDWRSFSRAVLTARNSEVAHVWGSLFFMPEPVASYYVRNFIADPWARDRVDRVVKSFDSIYGRRFFTRARGIGPGFQLLYRAVPFVGNHAGPRMPHSPALWLDSLEFGSPPRDEADLEKSVAKSMKDEHDAADCLKGCITRTSIESHDPFPIDRYLRTGHVFENNLGLLTPDNIYLLNRMAAHFPSALDTLERLRPGRADVVRRYCMLVFELGVDEETAGHVTRFQGGLHTLALMFEAGKAREEVLESAFERWLELFEAREVERNFPARQAEWFRELLEQLPVVSEAAPGRGPLERAWLDSITAAGDPQIFVWGEMTYEGHRGGDRTGRMLRLLEAERIQPLDGVLEISTLLGELLEACRWSDLETAAQVSARLLERIDTATTALGPALADEIGATARKIAQTDNRRKLPGFERRLEQLQREAAEPIDLALAAPAYLIALSGIDNILFAGETLIRRHEVFDRQALASLRKPAPWNRARLIRGTDSGAGPYFTGSLGDVLRGLIEIQVKTMNPGPTAQHAVVLPRQTWWYQDVVRSTWSSVTPDALAAASALVAAGDTILNRALAETPGGGPTLQFVSRRIPLYRLEKEAARSSGPSRITLSERLSLGLAALEGDDFGKPAPELIDESSRPALIETLRDAREDPRALYAIGAPTPQVNGRYRPWIGTWLPYEALDRDVSLAGLAQRELLDIRLAVALFLSANDLPTDLGTDLEEYAVVAASRELRLDSLENWQSVVRWLNGLDDAYFGKGMRQCFRDGRYRVLDF